MAKKKDDFQKAIDTIKSFKGNSWQKIAHIFDMTSSGFEKGVYESGNEELIRRFDILKERIQVDRLEFAIETKNPKLIEGLAETLDLYKKVDIVESVELYGGEGHDDGQKINCGSEMEDE